jgi:hypothetical protein
VPRTLQLAYRDELHAVQEELVSTRHERDGAIDSAIVKIETANSRPKFPESYDRVTECKVVSGSANV